jgi:hypothetical protein
MTTTHTRTKILTGAVIATIAAPALLLLSGDTAQATPDISARGPAGAIADLPTPRECPGCGGFNSQPDPSGYPEIRPPMTSDPGSIIGIIINGGVPSPSLNPADTAGVMIHD